MRCIGNCFCFLLLRHSIVLIIPGCEPILVSCVCCGSWTVAQVRPGCKSENVAAIQLRWIEIAAIAVVVKIGETEPLKVWRIGSFGTGAELRTLMDILATKPLLLLVGRCWERLRHVINRLR